MALRAIKNDADAQCADAMESTDCGASLKERGRGLVPFFTPRATCAR